MCIENGTVRFIREDLKDRGVKASGFEFQSQGSEKKKKIF